jgi:2-keto-3-deoxy-6-phosphogluconate aldolase
MLVEAEVAAGVGYMEIPVAARAGVEMAATAEARRERPIPAVVGAGADITAETAPVAVPVGQVLL